MLNSLDMETKSSTTIIRPKKLFSLGDLDEVWDYRELIYFFSWRDLKVRYKQTVIGVAWAVIQPLFAMVVFSFFFGRLAQIPSDGVPYPIFVYTGLLFWQFFSDSLGDVSNSLVGNQSIITKVYFPRVVLAISPIITKLIDFFIGALILGGLMLYYQISPSLISLVTLPLLLLITFMCAMGTGLLLAAINVKYRDVRYVLPYFMQLLIFLTPVIYPASIAGKYSKLLALNPMMGVIQNARAALLGTAPVNWTLISISFIACLFLLATGFYVFKKVERYFADII